MQISKPYVGADENNGLAAVTICDQQIRILYIPHILYVHIIWHCMLLVSWATWPCFTYSIWVFGGLPRSLSLVLFTVLGQSEIQLGASNGMTRIENGPILLSVLKMSRTRTHTHRHTLIHTHFSYFHRFLEKLLLFLAASSMRGSNTASINWED